MKSKKTLLQSLHALQVKLQEPSLTILLVIQCVTLFIIAPSVEFNESFHWSVDFCVLMMAFVSVFIVASGTAEVVTISALLIGIAGIIFSPDLRNTSYQEIIGTISVLLFTGSVSSIVLYKIYNNEPVTLHKIRGAVVVYLNLALMFGYVDNFLASVIPHAYSSLPGDNQHTIGRMVYFSLTTLTTTGYGDIVPIHPFARSLANFESVVGQFYMAILIGTLVGLHVSHRQKGSGR